MNTSSESVHCIRCFTQGTSREELKRNCRLCREDDQVLAGAVRQAIAQGPVVAAVPRPHLRFRFGKWHCYRSFRWPSKAQEGLVGSGSTPQAAWDHLRLQERIAPPSLLQRGT
jgi:hypothetical protein